MGEESSLILGAHLTISGGLAAAMDLCAELGGNTFQFFTRNPRGGKQREMTDAEIAEGAGRRTATGVRALVGHFPYTVNLASPRPDAYRFARDVLRQDLRWGDRMGADVLVVHPGSHVGEGVEAGIERIVGAVQHALDGYGGRTRLLLETMAGQGSEVGYDPEHLRRILEAVDWHPALGVCLDSCHLFAAGFDLRTPEGVEEMVGTFDRVLGLDRVGCLHLNDSKAPLGSRRDRHELVGRGHLGREGIRAILQHPFLRTLPVVLETPVSDIREYADEIRAVREILAA